VPTLHHYREQSAARSYPFSIDSFSISSRVTSSPFYACIYSGILHAIIRTGRPIVPELLAALAIDGISKIADLLSRINALTGVKRREFLDEVVKPAFEALDEINDFYNAINLEFRKGVSTLFSNQWPTDSLPTYTELSELKEKYLDERTRDEHLRDALRRDAMNYLQKIQWPEERRFFVSVAYYFLGTGGIAPTNDAIDLDISEVIRVDSRQHWETPSSLLFNKIRDEQNLLTLLDVLTSREICKIRNT
jgi:hypothetical protein